MLDPKVLIGMGDFMGDFSDFRIPLYFSALRGVVLLFLDRFGRFSGEVKRRSVRCGCKKERSDMALNYRLKAARALRGLTQIRLAEIVGMKEIEISRLETGRAQPDRASQSSGHRTALPKSRGNS